MLCLAALLGRQASASGVAVPEGSPTVVEGGAGVLAQGGASLRASTFTLARMCRVRITAMILLKRCCDQMVSEIRAQFLGLAKVLIGRNTAKKQQEGVKEEDSTVPLNCTAQSEDFLGREALVPQKGGR